MSKRTTKTKLILSCFTISLLFIGFMFQAGCGKAAQNLSSASNTGSLSQATQSQEGGALYQKYKDKFPENLMNLSADDFLNKLSAHSIIQASGEEVEIYVTTEVAKDVVDLVEASYPSYNAEEYANKKAEELTREHPAFAGMISNAADAPDTDKIDITEEEFKKKITQELRNKEDRIGAEKNFMIVSELAKPEVQAQIKASVARIQASINSAKEVGQYFDFGYNGKGFNKNEMALLIRHPHYWWGTVSTCVTMPQWTKEKFGNAADSTKANSYQHSMWNVRLAKVAELWTSESGCKWWAKAFTDAHENPGSSNWYSSAGQMDLNNNGVGRKVFDDNAWDQPLYITVRIGQWTVIRIHYATVTRTNSISTMRDNLYSKALAATKVTMSQSSWNRANDGKVFTPNDSTLIYLSEDGNGLSGVGSGGKYYY